MNQNDLHIIWQQLLQTVAAEPWWMWLMLAILPALPVPATVLLVLMGAAWRPHPIAGMGLGLLAMAINMVWSYWAARAMRAWLEPIIHVASRKQFIGRGGKMLSTLAKLIVKTGTSWEAVAALRLTPGIPFCVQNAVPGILRWPFGRYVVVSLACNWPQSLVFLWIGMGLAGPDAGRAVAYAAVVLLMFGVLRRMVSKRLVKS